MAISLSNLSGLQNHEAVGQVCQGGTLAEIVRRRTRGPGQHHWPPKHFQVACADTAVEIGGVEGVNRFTPEDGGGVKSKLNLGIDHKAKQLFLFLRTRGPRGC